jgi:hypothetical protein
MQLRTTSHFDRSYANAPPAIKRAFLKQVAFLLADIRPSIPTGIRRWPQAPQPYSTRAFAGHGQNEKEEARLAALERLVGPLTLENALRKKPHGGSTRESMARPALEAAAVRGDHDHPSAGRSAVRRAQVSDAGAEPGGV